MLLRLTLKLKLLLPQRRTALKAVAAAEAHGAEVVAAARAHAER